MGSQKCLMDEPVFLRGSGLFAIHGVRSSPASGGALRVLTSAVSLLSGVALPLHRSPPGVRATEPQQWAMHPRGYVGVGFGGWTRARTLAPGGNRAG